MMVYTQAGKRSNCGLVGLGWEVREDAATLWLPSGLVSCPRSDLFEAQLSLQVTVHFDQMLTTNASSGRRSRN